MSEAKETSFKFINFFVKESHIILNEQGEFKISVDFQPKGYVFKSLNQFHLELNIEVKEESNKFNIKLSGIAVFEFAPEADIEKYTSSLFVVNAPAIAFPYLRAYITNLTAQSGLFTITLPTFNLTGLAENLKKNIKIIE
jgi:preprotein translocase subunit SecB